MPADERLVFPSLIEGYMKGLGPRFDDALKRKLKANGLDVAKLPPAVPANDMLAHMRTIAAHGWPDEPELEQLRLLGLSAIRGWSTGLLGSAASAMIRLVGPRRALNRLDRAFSTTNNFNRAKQAALWIPSLNTWSRKANKPNCFAPSGWCRPITTLPNSRN